MVGGRKWFQDLGAFLYGGLFPVALMLVRGKGEASVLFFFVEFLKVLYRFVGIGSNFVINVEVRASYRLTGVDYVPGRDR